MDKDIEKLIEEEKRSIISAELFKAAEDKSKFPYSTAKIKTAELVDNAFSQAVIAKIAQSDDIKIDLMNTAEKVIKNQTDAIGSDAEAMSKKANFNNKKSACDCFGYNEDTTEKWAVNIMNMWHNIMTAVWMFIGCFTFAPITFIAKKITVIIKRTWIAVLVSVLIYLTVVLTPIITTLF